ncbi:ABC transporter substrate-binding protein [Streptacidiphilus pinicola]|uniref:ABC transporter substrate-binding protein n=1 Tax=Streptacidiphilus pinicola TaxID=2219663 RepID=A0A2X0ISZ7_9ACTN|nr:MCE family protein [Streptacidiphilus pinicola]RAG86713.1 ABC transporter substrate-binding protein [Streptacidiphilus pinicola]
MTPFRERNPLVIGAVGLGLIVAMLAAAFNAQDLPLIGGGTDYAAAFSEAGGLKPGDDVRIAGVKVGQVQSLDLEGDHVRIDFRVQDGVDFGTQTGAAVKIKTVLGAKYLALEPAGPGQLPAGREIPLDRTVSAYDVVQAFSDLATTTDQIDTRQLAVALDTVAATFKDSPTDVKASLAGISRLSQTVSSRDSALRDLLAHADSVTAVLSDRSTQLTTLIDDGNALLTEIQGRRDVIHTLLVNTAALAAQLTGLVQDNQTQITPALSRLGDVLAVLQRNQDNLDHSIRLLAPFVRVFANNLGNGRWFDTYVQNLVAAPVSAQGSTTR